MRTLIERFNSVNSLKISLEQEIEDTELVIKEYSNMLGEKIRTNEESSADDPEFLALKAKLDGGSSDDKSKDKNPRMINQKTKIKRQKIQRQKSKDDKSKIKKVNDKKKKSKKGHSDRWYNLNEILVYNGIGKRENLNYILRQLMSQNQS